MNIDKVNVHNFKCLVDAQIDLSKITLLTGANSSGKSSVLFSLLGALQTDKFPLFYSPNGDYVNMGDFREISFEHRRDANITIEMELSSGKRRIVVKATYYENAYNKMPRLDSLVYKGDGLDLTIEKDSLYQARFSYNPSEDSRHAVTQSRQFRNFFKSLVNFVAETSRQQGKGSDPAELDKEIKEMVESWEKPSTSGDFSFRRPSDFSAAVASQKHFYLTVNLQDISQVFSQINRKFNYVSSFRHAPQRTYYQTSKASLKIGKYGENFTDQLSEWESSKNDAFTQLKKYMRQLELAADLRITRMRGGRYEIVVKSAKEAVPASLLDVGFGVSQVLPILVADLQLGRDSLLAVSQPEIHLHPSVQAELATYFADQVTRHNKRYVLETHSEYLINRLRLLVAKGKLEPEDVSLIYLRNTCGTAEVFPVHLHKDGSIQGAPKDFFDTYMMDVMDIALHS